MYKVFEAFSGIGTQHMALKRIGIPFDVVAISDNDFDKVKAYEAIHGKAINLGDICEIKIQDIPNHDLFTYSFPCTDLSRQGKEQGMGEGSGTRSSLIWECKKVIEHKKPKFLLMENVKALVNKKNKEEFNKWLDWLESHGYTNSWKVINALDGFIPQNRERVFCISILGERQFDFSKVIGSNTKILSDILEEDAITPLYHNIYGGFNEKKARIFPAYSPTIRCAKGGGHLPSVGTTGKATKIIEGVPIRQITPLEAWRLMGIDDSDFYKAKATGLSNTKLYNQAGDAIVVDVLVAIFKELLK